MRLKRGRRKPRNGPPYPFKLRQLLRNLGVSQGELSRRTKINGPRISKWCQGTKLPNWHSLCRLADALGVSIDQFRCPEGGGG